MKYLLGRKSMVTNKLQFGSLNPYCYGISSLTGDCSGINRQEICLNPYCYGISSLTYCFQFYKQTNKKCLNPYCYGISSLTGVFSTVLFVNNLES